MPSIWNIVAPFVFTKNDECPNQLLVKNEFSSSRLSGRYNHNESVEARSSGRLQVRDKYIGNPGC